MSKQGILVEICCGSLEDALEAEQGGADRIELCSALFLGGLTPSLGTVIEAKARLKIPMVVMIRPRGGGFCYTEPEMAAMERDTVLAVEQGAEGIVFGILNADGSIDEERCRRLRKLVGDRQAVFHRAFDVTPDPLRALDQLVELGFTRVLTSGQEDTAPEGLPLIKRLIEYAGDRIEVLPGGGIKLNNLRQVVESTGCKQVHLTAFKTQFDTSVRGRPLVTFGGALYPPEDQYQVADRHLVEQVVHTLKDRRQKSEVRSQKSGAKMKSKAQKLDLYKVHKAEYVSPKKPVLIQTKPAKYLTITGQGAPGGEAFQAGVGALYNVAFTLKMAKKFAGKDYKVCHLEGLWWGDKEGEDFAAQPPDTWNWKLIIRVPDFIGAQDLRETIATLKEKGMPPEVGRVKLETIDEGQCVQMLHVGPYSKEGETIAQMIALARENRLSFRGRHHEIYLSDPRRVPAERLRTILRLPAA